MTSPTRRIRLHAETTADTKGLVRTEEQLERTARAADRLGTSMSDAEADAKGLRRETHDLGDDLERLGRRGNKTMSSLFDFGGSGLRPRNALIGALVGAAAAAAPTVGAMIAGAVTGAVGVGGIAGGIFAAARAPAVKQAAAQFAENISGSFFQMGDQFVEPLVNAFQILERGWHSLNLEGAFEKVAAYVDDLAYGISGFAKGLVDGLSNALGNAGPILSLMRTELPRLGDALGYMFDRMSQGRSVVEGFAFLMRTLDAVIIGTGNTIGWLADRFHDMISIEAKLFGVLEQLPAKMGGTFFAEFNDRLENLIGLGDESAQTLNYVGRESQVTAGSIKATSDAIGKLNDGLLEQNNRMLAASDATLAYQADLLRLNESVREHGTSLKMSTEQGVANRQMINQLIGDLIRERDAAIDAAEGNEEKVRRAKAKYNEQIQKLQELLARLGFEKAEIAKIIAAYKAIPTRVYTQIIQDYQTRGVPAGEHSGPRSGERRAAGGPVLPGIPYMINEAGRETVTFPAAGTVHPASLTPVSAGTAVVTIDVRGGEDEFKRLIRKWVRIDGAGSVQTAFGR